MDRGLYDVLFQLYPAIADFTHFECRVPSRHEDTLQFQEDTPHLVLPFTWFSQYAYRHRPGVNTDEPAAQPVIGRIIDDVQEGRRRDHQVNRIIFDSRGLLCVTGQKDWPVFHVHHELVPGRPVIAAQQRFGLLLDYLDHIPPRRHLVSPLVYLLLRLNRHRLVGGHGVDRKKAR